MKFFRSRCRWPRFRRPRYLPPAPTPAATLNAISDVLAVLSETKR